MASISRRQFASATALTGLGVVLWPREFGAQSGNPPLGQPINSSQLLVTIPVNNVPTTFLVDSSNPFSMITPATASGLGLVANGQQTVALPGAGSVLNSQVYGATLAGDSSTFNFEMAAVDDLSLVTTLAGSTQMDGILGADFFSQFSDISLDGGTLTGTLNGPSPSPSPSPSPTPMPSPSPSPTPTTTPKAGALAAALGVKKAAANAALPPPFTVTYPVRKIGNDYFVFVTIIDGAGRRRVLIFLLDTGAQVTMLNTQQALNLGLLPLQIGPAPFIPMMIPIGGIGGGALAPITPVNLPGLGTFPVVIGNVPGPGFVAGLLGADVLGGNFTLTIRNGRGTLTITTPLGQLIELLIDIFQSVVQGVRNLVGG